ncbi:MAG: glycoside hydrolase family 28 protein [Spirochaetes bacterium]|nr:glycoside hydrolase family 28 protein [Spirochaetota bacterium]
MFKKSYSVIMMVFSFCFIFNFVSSAEAKVSFQNKNFDITKFGAKGDSITDDNEAIQKAIDICAKEGGGTVIVPAGKYLTGPIFFKSNVRFEIKKNAVIIFSTETSLYKSTDQNRNYSSSGWVNLMAAYNESNIAIVGEGVIDGQGKAWWDAWRAEVKAKGKKSGTNRPRLLYFTNVNNVLIDGVTFLNSPSFHVVFRNSENIDVNNVKIDSPEESPNTDGIDPMDTRNMSITNCIVSCGDDHIAIKGNRVDPKYPASICSNIIIKDCTFLAGRGLSIGSESSGGVKDVYAENITFKGSMYGIRIKCPRGNGGEVSKITYKNIKMENVATPIVVSGYYDPIPNKEEEKENILKSGGFILGNQIYPNDQDPPKKYISYMTPYFHDVTFIDLISTGDSINAGFVFGLPEKPFKKIVFNNVKIEAKNGLKIRNAIVIDKGLEVTVPQGERAIILEKNGKIRKF